MNYTEWKQDLEYLVFNVYGCSVSELIKAESLVALYRKSYSVEEAFEKIEEAIQSR